MYILTVQNLFKKQLWSRNKTQTKQSRTKWAVNLVINLYSFKWIIVHWLAFFTGYTFLKQPLRTVLWLDKAVITCLNPNEISDFKAFTCSVFLWLATKMSLETNDIICFENTKRITKQLEIVFKRSVLVS